MVEEGLSCACRLQKVEFNEILPYLSLISSDDSQLPSAHVQRLSPLQGTLIPEAPSPPHLYLYFDQMQENEMSGNCWNCPAALGLVHWPFSKPVA